jgi:hypothetical protein
VIPTDEVHQRLQDGVPAKSAKGDGYVDCAVPLPRQAVLEIRHLDQYAAVVPFRLASPPFEPFDVRAGSHTTSGDVSSVVAPRSVRADGSAPVPAWWVEIQRAGPGGDGR